MGTAPATAPASADATTKMRIATMMSDLLHVLTSRRLVELAVDTEAVHAAVDGGAHDLGDEPSDEEDGQEPEDVRDEGKKEFSPSWTLSAMFTAAITLTSVADCERPFGAPLAHRIPAARQPPHLSDLLSAAQALTRAAQS